MFISKVFVIFFMLLVSSVIAAPVVKEQSPDAELLPRGRIAASVTYASIKNKITKFLRPQHDKAVFWSGKIPTKKGGTVSVGGHAANYAKTHGKETIGQAMKRADINIPKNHPHSWKLWKHASNVFAKHASGVVHTILGSILKVKNVYHTIEKPILMKKPEVHTLIERNEETKKVTVVKPIPPKKGSTINK